MKKTLHSREWETWLILTCLEKGRFLLTDISVIGASQVAPVVRNPPVNAGDTSYVGLIPGPRSPGRGYGNSLQYSCLRNSTDRGAWQATVHGVTKSWAWLSTHILLIQIHFLWDDCINISKNSVFRKLKKILKLLVLKAHRDICLL